MTHDEIDKLEAGPELDALMTTEVMGWEKGPEWNWYLQWNQDHSDYRVRILDGGGPDDFMPSTDIAAAWEVHKTMQKRPFSVRRQYHAMLQHVVSRRIKSSWVISWPDVFGLIEPEDICRAALIVVMNPLAVTKTKDEG